MGDGGDRQGLALRGPKKVGFGCGCGKSPIVIVEIDGCMGEIVEIDFIGGLTGLGDSEVRFLEVTSGVGFGVQLTLDEGELG